MTEEIYTLQPAGGAPVDENGEKKVYATIPEGTTLEAELLGIEKKVQPYKDDDGNEVTKVEFAFRVIEEGEYLNRRVWGQTPTTFSTHEDCKLTQWIKDILGVDDLPTGFTFRPADLKGSKVRVNLGVRTYTPRNSTEEKAVNFVGELLPSRSLGNASAAPAPNVSAPVPETVAAPAPTLASVASSLGGVEEEPF